LIGIIVLSVLLFIVLLDGNIQTAPLMARILYVAIRGAVEHPV